MNETGQPGGVVELSFWPTCKNALAWSLEDLAVAAGEVVHMLTPRHALEPQDSSEQKQWHTFTFRVNQFELSEWPMLSLATLKQFSIGEELSDSTVSSLAWSPEGLGIYRRSVLAVLTSNLILSFWETNGRLGVWRRTCIVNTSLSLDRVSENSDNARLTRRIRCFAWLPTLPAPDGAQWSPHLLVLADDTRCVSVYSVHKTDRAAYGHWSFSLLARQQIVFSQNQLVRPASKSSLRAFLLDSVSVSGLEPTEWSIEDGANGEVSPPISLKMKVSLGQMDHAVCLSIRSEKIVREATKDPMVEHNLQITITESQFPKQSPLLPRPMENLFDSSIQKPRLIFSNRFNLGQRVHVRYWGTALSPDRTKAAACVSFHPSDMIESCPPSKQRTSVVFAGLESAVTRRPVKDGIKVYDEILRFVAGIPTSFIKTKFDRTILSRAATLIKLHFEDSKELTSWVASLSSYLSTELTTTQPERAVALLENPEDVSQNDFKGMGILDPVYGESCELCKAQIPFTATTSATCTKGHYFSRCNISFVAIQEPGISMLCAQCGKQFLDPGKFEATDGQSLSQMLFNRFDVCPYCQGKFRG